MSFTRHHKDGEASVQGQACIACHNLKEGDDIVSFGGTLSSYIHTPNAKYYQDLSSYRVNIVGENSLNLTFSTVVSGSILGQNNFYTRDESYVRDEAFTAFVTDENGTVVNQSGTNTHNTSTHRDCNSCHSAQGANGAPGRVLVPLSN